ncbi:hypothetical protein C8P70_11461 [Myroides indicus]|uniref:HTH cro/C1-type domain-containing protein n=2 Tax=Myroides indicus TaxID=1323422 RepID=A0A4R7EV94_9FLAO|nr:hypothetical protein C8P70_11461 [Myroides indicus]
MKEITTRFFEVYKLLKEEGKIASQEELGSIIGTNKSGISDIKYGRKKLSLDNLINMISSYENINIEFILFNKKPVFKNLREDFSITTNYSYLIELQEKHIQKLEQEIQQLRKGGNSLINKFHTSEFTE